MILTLGCQHSLSEKSHLTNESLKVWLSRRVRCNEWIFLCFSYMCLGCIPWNDMEMSKAFDKK